MQQELLNSLGNDFWNSLGLGSMSDSDKNSLTLYIYAEMQKRVAARLMSNLAQDRLTEFELLINKGEENQAVLWFEQNCPDYSQVVKSELIKIKKEIFNYPQKHLLTN